IAPFRTPAGCRNVTSLKSNGNPFGTAFNNHSNLFGKRQTQGGAELHTHVKGLPTANHCPRLRAPGNYNPRMADFNRF
ncbi:MAG: hypothetical protein M3Y56_08700, partial [Armatimonadota bacterium]|nr:hypothetical protein [Armatimonadota bacterium]